MANNPQKCQKKHFMFTKNKPKVSKKIRDTLVSESAHVGLLLAVRRGRKPWRRHGKRKAADGCGSWVTLTGPATLSHLREVTEGMGGTGAEAGRGGVK